MQIDTKEDQLALIECIDVKLASVKRAMNTSSSPRFRVLYEEDFATFNQLRINVAGATIGAPELVPTEKKK